MNSPLKSDPGVTAPHHPTAAGLSGSVFTQDELKTQVGLAALAYVPKGAVIGVGTGSTVNKFIDALASIRADVAGAVSSSEASTQRLRAIGIPVLDAATVSHLGVYIDGADEIEAHGYMIKGGGAALTREKIVAAMAERFVCIADESKLVATLGLFPLPVEVIPMAAVAITRRFEALGGTVTLRQAGGEPLRTDNGQLILDVRGLQIADPLAFESEVNDWPGVVTVGVFAHQRAHVCLLAAATGVRTLVF